MTAEGAAGLVLVAEDDRDLRDIIASFLEARGWRVVALPITPEIGEHLAFRQLTVAVVDVPSATSAGFRLVEQLRARIATLPVVVIASFGDAYIAPRVKSMGATHVIEKPFDLEELDVVLARVRLEA